jgi:hypothetical protein
MRKPAPVTERLADLAAALTTIVAARAVCGGSLASGEFVPDVSDLDLPRSFRQGLFSGQQRTLTGRPHKQALRLHPAAARLHCLYIAAEEVQDLTAGHPMRDGRKLATGTLTGMAKTELLRTGLTLARPASWGTCPAVSDDALRAAVRGGLSGYRTAAIGWQLAWCVTCMSISAR